MPLEDFLSTSNIVINIISQKFYFKIYLKINNQKKNLIKYLLSQAILQSPPALPTLHQYLSFI